MWGRKYDIWCWLGMNYLWQVILTFTLNTETYHCPEQRYKAQEGGGSVSWLLLCNGLCAWVKQDRQERRRGGARSSHSSGWSDWRCYSPLQPSHLSAGSSLQVQWGQVTQTEAAFLSQNPLQLHGSWTIQALDCSMSSVSSADTRFQLWETMWADMNYFEKHEFPTSVYLVLCWVGLFVDRLAFSVKKKWFYQAVAIQQYIAVCFIDGVLFSLYCRIELDLDCDLKNFFQDFLAVKLALFSWPFKTSLLSLLFTLPPCLWSQGK